MQWKPNTTVAAIVHHDGQFLMVEEDTPEGVRINQPAGHLEEHESLIQAVIRETLEETAHDFVPESLLGVYQWRHPTKALTYMRFAFIGSVTGKHAHRALDHGIQRAVWMSYDSLKASQTMHRSPQVLRCVEDFLSGQSFPLTVVTHLSDVTAPSTTLAPALNNLGF